MDETQRVNVTPAGQSQQAESLYGRSSTSRIRPTRRGTVMTSASADRFRIRNSNTRTRIESCRRRGTRGRSATSIRTGSMCSAGRAGTRPRHWHSRLPPSYGEPALPSVTGRQRLRGHVSTTRRGRRDVPSGAERNPEHAPDALGIAS
jgi:hypothetical protein